MLDSSLVDVFSWYVIRSSQAYVASTWRAMCAIYAIGALATYYTVIIIIGHQVNCRREARVSSVLCCV
jgi:hypothetical protein